MVQPPEPEQVALLGRAGRVVGERVEQPGSGSLKALASPVVVLVERLGGLLQVPERLAARPRVNGRIWWWIGPTVSRNSGRVWRSAGPSACAAGISRRDAGPSCRANRSPLCQRARVSRSVAGQLLQRRLGSRPPDGRTTPSTSLEERTNPASWVSLWPSCLADAAEVRDHPRDVLAPLGKRAADLRQVAGGGREALQAGRELGAVLAAQPLAGRLQAEAGGRTACRASSEARI